MFQRDNLIDAIVCIRFPHLFKPLQAVNAVLLLISLGSADSVDGAGVLWFITLVSLVISTVATVLFMLDKNEPILISLSGGVITWNVCEFVYSTILTVLCAISIWLSLGYSGHVTAEGHSTGYVFAGMFMILQIKVPFLDLAVIIGTHFNFLDIHKQIHHEYHF